MAKNLPQIRRFFENDKVQERFASILNEDPRGFLASVFEVIENNSLLQKADPKSIMYAAATSAMLELPINQDMGMAYIVPYKGKAQFQIGYRGFRQLAMRTNKVERMEDSVVYEGETADDVYMRIRSVVDLFRPEEGAQVVGYISYIKLTNGFEKSLYMTTQELEKHGKQYSQTYKKGFGLWKTDFDAMARKTVTKQLISKYAPLSRKVQMAIRADQAVIEDWDLKKVSYPDNEKPSQEELDRQEESKRIEGWIDSQETVEKLEEVSEALYELDDKELIQKYEDKLKKLKK